MSIKDNILKIKSEIDTKTKLVAVSKTRGNDLILEAYNNNQIDFGENRVQELAKKHEDLPKDIKWHMIGHLQTNKVKYIAKFITLIHTVDSIKLIDEINKRAKNEQRIIDCLLQVHIANEEHKFGFKISEISEIIDYTQGKNNIRIRGLMGMATNTKNNQQINQEFQEIKNLYNEIKLPYFDTLSIGMSSDYQIAIKNEGNMIRVGSAIFGARH
jgi:pyridoxal phosphate enzyme (YggS family)